MAGYYAIAPLLCALVTNELQMTIYVDRPMMNVYNPTGVVSVDKPGPLYFGKITMWDVRMATGTGPEATILGSALFTHSRRGSPKNIWHTSITLMFEGSSSFKGSTLLVEGSNCGNCELAITGGTGEFAMARGIVRRRIIKVPGSTRSQELTIKAYYTPKAALEASGGAGCNPLRREV